jgi:hypothetical protein
MCDGMPNIQMRIECIWHNWAAIQSTRDLARVAEYWCTANRAADSRLPHERQAYPSPIGTLGGTFRYLLSPIYH